MSLLGDLVGAIVRPRADANPDDERWWTGSSPIAMTSTGAPVSPAVALQVSCYFQGMRLIAETLGSLPLKLYRERGDGGKDQVRDHELWRTLRRQANPWQTAQQWRETMTAHAITWGAGYSKKVWTRDDSGAPRLELHPLDPDAVTVEQLATGRLRFRVRKPDTTEEVLLQEEVFRVQGLGVHRFMGATTVLLARESIALWIAQEKFAATYFGQGASQGVWLEHPRKLSTDAYNRLKESAAQRYSGPANWHKVQIAEEGMKPHAIGFNAEESQLVEAREAQVLEIARWLNIPEHMLRAGKQPTFASVEQFAREFVDYTIRPWAVRWEAAIDRDLVDEDDVFAEHLLDGLLRGNTTDRANAYRTFVETGVMTRNEVRLRENLNPLPGLDEPLTPLNMSRTTDAGGEADNEDEEKDASATQESDSTETLSRAAAYLDSLRSRHGEDGLALVLRAVAAGASGERAEPLPARTASAESIRLRAIAQASAARLVRKELARLRDLAVRNPTDQAAFLRAAEDFYAQHQTLIAETLQIPTALARDYCDNHVAELAERGLAAPGAWETTATDHLTALAVEETPDA